MVFNNCIPRGGLPVQHESSAMRSVRDSDSVGRQWKKNQSVTSQASANTRAISNLQTQVNKLRRRIVGGYTPPFTQQKPMFPFRIYKPNPLPPDGTAVTTFDSNGAQVAAVVNSTVPTDAGFSNGGTWAVTPPPVNPNTDAWRFWNVRTGLVEVRPWFSVIQLFSDVGQLQGNYSEWDFVLSGTDGVEPQSWDDEFDDPRTTSDYGTTLIIPGTPDPEGGIGFSIWIQVVPDADEYGYIAVAIMGKTWAEIGGVYGEPFPDSSPLVIPIGLIITSNYGIIPIVDVTDLTVWQLTFDHILNRWPPGMFGAGYTFIDPITGLPITIPGGVGGYGALSYRGDWDDDDIQDMVFYPGDVIKVSRIMLVGTSKDNTNTVTFTLKNLYMAQTICFTDDPSDDDNFTIISGSTLASA